MFILFLKWMKNLRFNETGDVVEYESDNGDRNVLTDWKSGNVEKIK